MNDYCNYYRPHLHLYAEAELHDPALRERVGLHLRHCPDCQDWLDEYAQLTRRIHELTESAAQTPKPAFFESDDELTDHSTHRVARIMSGVERFSRRSRRKQRLSYAAAAVLLLVSIVAMTLGPIPAERSSLDVATPTVPVTSFSNRRAHPADGKQSLIRWVVQGDDQPRRNVAEPVSLLGVAARGERSRVYWVFEATPELFLDPLGGGWVYLVPERSNVHGARSAVPIRRLSVRELDGAEPLASYRPARETPAYYYRLVVVPGGERALRSPNFRNVSLFENPATQLQRLDPESLFRERGVFEQRQY